MTTTAHARDWMNDLMADAAWTRRLASALLGDPDAAADARQEAWLRTRGQGGAENPRAWFRTVIGNALRSQRRAQLRRRSREQVGVAAAEAAPSPEDLLARLETQKLIAGLVTALEEPGRQMVLLRYYEGLSSSQIADATGEPAGTVRWRLRNALIDLRGQLEKHYGERGQNWRAVLLPLAPAAGGAATAASGGEAVGSGDDGTAASGSAAVAAPLGARGLAPGLAATAASGRRTAVVLLLGSALVGAVLLLIGLMVRARSSAPEAVAVAAAAGENGGFPPASGRARRPGGGGRPGPNPPALAAAVLARACPQEVEAVDRKVSEARRALAYYLPARTAFHDNAAANPAGVAAVTPVINRLLDEMGAPAQERAIKCQGDACKIKVTEPWPVRAPWVEHRPSPQATAAVERITHHLYMEGPVEERDVSPSVAETWIWLRLRERPGAPDPAFPPWLAPSGSGDPQAAGRARSEDCRAALAPLETELEALRLRAEAELRAEVLFERETAPNPTLAAKLQRLVDRIHQGAATPAGDRAIPLAVTCRGMVCKVEPPGGVPIRSDSMAAVAKDPELATQIRRVSFESKNGRANGPLFFSVVRAPAESRSGGDMLRHFVAGAKKDDVLGICRKRAAASGQEPNGKLTVQLFCPGEGESNQDGVLRRISFRLSDSLADAPFGRCLAEQLTARAAAFELPADLSRAELEKTIELP